MRNLYPRRLCSLLALFLLVAQNNSLLSSRAQQNAIDTYTITGARIMTVSGPVIEQ